MMLPIAVYPVKPTGNLTLQLKFYVKPLGTDFWVFLEVSEHVKVFCRTGQLYWAHWLEMRLLCNSE